ncbi:MAG: hypothetical protein LBE07_09975 [Gordonia sp. (in: high G+C Gram-positive bacteria)]|jgi:hypothetical protein|nr:hypothetical protein [Gordonia sp. (in: high G+C Gram-positive bacteria)]
MRDTIPRPTSTADGALLHRSGLVVRGDAVSENDCFPIRSGPVTVRLSKALGSPGSLPDAIGVAVRLAPDTVDTGDGWDLVMSGPERRAAGMPLMWPAFRWNAVPLTAHGRFRYRGRTWRVFGELFTQRTGSGLDLDDLSRGLSRTPGVLTLTASPDGQPSTPLGTVEFGGDPVTEGVAAFDPMSVPDDVRPIRGWWDDLRHAAYRGRNG